MFAICELGSAIGKQNDVHRPVRKSFFIKLKLLLCTAAMSNRLANGPKLLLYLAIMCNILHIWRPMRIGGLAPSSCCTCPGTALMVLHVVTQDSSSTGARVGLRASVAASGYYCAVARQCTLLGFVFYLSSYWTQRPIRDLDPLLDRGSPTHLWLEGPCHVRYINRGGRPGHG
jgi:hypothetical protein